MRNINISQIKEKNTKAIPKILELRYDKSTANKIGKRKRLKSVNFKQLIEPERRLWIHREKQ